MKINKHINARGSILAIVLLVGIFVIATGLFIYKKTNDNKQVNSNSVNETNSQNSISDEAIDNSKLPLGDNKYSISGPQKGYIYSCVKIGGGGGAFKEGEWIDSKNGTWSKADKNVFVDGSIEWPNANFEIKDINSSRQLKGNGLPTNHSTGNFPVDRSDDAYGYDRNPNSIKAQNILKTISPNPTYSSEPKCLNMGPVGYSLNGVAIFNALDGEGRDAAAHEILDKCGGHPERTGEYHYHDYSECMSEKSPEPKLIGYMLDGFGLYKYPADPTNEDLDECHGKTGEVLWNGVKQSIYHYVISTEYPYTIGCYRGK